MRQKFYPLLFGGDINVYSVARAFHEAYGVKSTCYGKYASGPAYRSAIIDYRVCEENEDPDAFRRNVCQFADERKEDTVLVIGCGCLAIPCNTSHYFADRLQAEISIPLLHMPRLTVRRLADQGKKRVALLATTGTVQAGVYSRECEAARLDFWTPDREVQEQVMSLIYDVVKAGVVITGTAVGGSIEGCVDRMNEKAEELGCADTHFMNTNGMPDEDHYSTAWDLYLIAKAAMEYDLFRMIVSTAEYTVEPTNLTEKTRHFYNTNGLLSEGRYEGYYYEYYIGIKTGTTNAAGNCLLSAAEKDGRTLVCVMMGCENPVDSEGNVQRLQFSQSIELLDWGFSSFSERTVLEAGQSMGQVSVTHAEENAVADGAVAVFLPNDVSSDAFEWMVDLADSVEAPVTEGQILGSATVSLDGESCGTVNLVAQSGVEEVLTFKEQAEELNLLEKCGKLLTVLAALVVIACVLFVVERNFRRQRQSRRRR